MDEVYLAMGGAARNISTADIVELMLWHNENLKLALAKEER
jgi:hypothetical protein